ncbi:hypothetical protein ACFWWM_07965 [Streptomyces sp. NPDC058682]|uniref:hypothetical protein n=1 Tax=Streptomyces sp. NPDC058682 TaxID=3346596 RepID=UPI00364C9D7B
MNMTMTVPDPATPEVVAGTVTLWSHNTDDGPISETGVTFGIGATARVSRPSNHWLVGLACR